MVDTLPDFIQVLAQALVYFLWQGVLIGLFTVLALHALRQARPQSRYAVACLAMLSCVVLPLVTVLAQLMIMSPGSTFVTSVQGAAVSEAPIRYELFAFPSMTVQFEIWFWVVAGWLCGTAAMSLRLMLGMVWISRARNSVQVPAQVCWQARLDSLAIGFGLSGKVALRLVDHIDSPLAAGWWRPVVLLPTALITNMPVALIEALLAHELAHIRRHDYFVNLLQNIVEALLFYHPVIWWLSHRIRIERELIADQIATEVIGTPRQLALALTELAEIQRTRPSLFLAQAANGGALMARIKALVRPVRGNQNAGARLAFSMVALMAASIATYTYAHISSSGSKAAIEHSSPDTTGAQPPKIRETFALLDNDGVPLFIWGPDDDLTVEVIARSGISSRAIWARRNHQDYVITDPSFLSKAALAWREADSLTLQMDDLDLQMQDQQRKFDSLEKTRQQTVKSPSSAVVMETSESYADRIDSQMRILERRYESLRSEQENAGERAARETHDLISHALAKGLAKHVSRQ